MSKLIAWSLTEGPQFIESAFIEDEGDTFALGVIKHDGSAYAYARVSKADMQAAFALLLPTAP